MRIEKIYQDLANYQFVKGDFEELDELFVVAA